MPVHFQGGHQKYFDSKRAEEIAAVEVTSCGLAKCLKGNMPVSGRALGAGGECRGGRGAWV